MGKRDSTSSMAKGRFLMKKRKGARKGCLPLARLEKKSNQIMKVGTANSKCKEAQCVRFTH